MTINDGIPKNKSLNESVSKKKKLSSTIEQSFNEPMARISSYTSPPLIETIIEVEKPLVITDYTVKEVEKPFADETR